MPTLSGNTSRFKAGNGSDAMEQIFGAARDEEVSEDFQRQLLETLCLSPHRQLLNGIGSIFSPEFNSGCAYELTSYGSLGSPDFTRQLNSAGFPDTQHFASSSHLPHGLSPLQLPQLPQGGVPWSQEPKWSQEMPWGPLSPRYPTLPPLQNGNSLQPEQLLQDSTELQSPGSAWLGMSPQELAHVPAPVTPQQRQQTQQPQQDTPQPLPALAVVLPQEQVGAGAAVDLPKPRQVHVPPGVWLVGPEAKHIPPVVQQSDSAAAAAAGMHSKAGLPMQQQKRQFRQQEGDPVSGKAARVHYSSTPASGSTAAAGAGSNAAPGSTADPLRTQPGSMHTASTAAAAAPKHKLGADAVLPGAAPTAKATLAVLGLGSLVWGKVNRFPWWPAVIVNPSADEEQPEAATAAAAAGASSPADRVFVRFLGTHDTARLEPGKVSPWTTQQGERASKTKAAAFTSALREARAYNDTGALPEVFKDALPPSAQDAWQQQQQPAEGRTQHKQRHKAKAAAAAGRAVDGSSSSSSARDHSMSRTSHSRPAKAEPLSSSSVHTRAGTLLAAAAGGTAEGGDDSHPDGNDSSRPVAQQVEAATASTAAAQDKGSAPTAGLSVNRRVVLKAAAAPGPLARTRSAAGSDVRQTRSGLRLRG